MTVSESTTSSFDAIAALVAELKLSRAAIEAVLKLVAEGGTVPFIARYRKEATGGLDEVQIRNIAERHSYLQELEARRASVLAEIGRQGKLSPELQRRILACTSKTELEDLYLPYKPKRRTRATIAKERGLDPLAELMWQQAATAPAEAALAFVNAEKEVPDIAAALSGARDICAERLAEDADVRARFRETLLEQGRVEVQKTKDFVDKKTKFDMYADFNESIASIPSHRYLAIRRGETEGVLRAGLSVETEPLVIFAQARLGLRKHSPWAAELEQVVKDASERLLLPAAQTDVRVELKTRSDAAAIDVFAQNLRQLLLAAPFGSKCVLGIDPGQRTGCKCAVVDDTGKLLDHTTVNLVQGERAQEQARQTLRDLCRKYAIRAIAVGNGTHGRETEAFAREILSAEGLTQVFAVSISEAGASVYSASDIAREEFPDLDLTVRGAISIARRLQDPLAELVKVDPKSIGVGQYQHDVFQALLARKLDEVVESCVNAVGVDVNTASASLLRHVAGIGPTLAKRIVLHRDQHGRFASRNALLKVTGLGPKAFQQAAGFLRVHDAEHPLDASAVHPERYALVERMAADLGEPVSALIAAPKLVEKLDSSRYLSDDVGEFTLNDILLELQKPGRDPRADFEPPKFRDDVRKIEDLTPGMELEGVVTNVAAFGAFVDLGVHQDGLVHISQLSDRFVKDPNAVVKVGDKLKVRVLEIDIERQRISLTARSQTAAGATGSAASSDTGARGAGKAQPQGKGGAPAHNASRGQQRSGPSGGKAPQASAKTFSNNPFADRFKRN